MRLKAFFMAAVFALILAGCGGSGGGGGTVVTPVITDIPSNLAADAFVGENLNTFVLSAPVVGSGVTLVGIDEIITPPSGTEFRGFLDFPLGGIPLGATIVSATLDVLVSTVEFASPVPIRIDMIDAPPPFASNDYDIGLLPPVLTLEPSTTGFNVVGPVRYLIDITPMMQQAQTLELPRLQLRLLLALTPGARGLVTIDDSSPATQPILTVEYL